MRKRRIVEAERRHYTDTRFKPSTIVITLEGCGHQRALGYPKLLPSQMLGQIYECEESFCGGN